MTQPEHDQNLIRPDDAEECPRDWKTLYFGQLSQEIVPFHPEPPEAEEDELTRAALSDAHDVSRADSDESGPPTLWRLLTIVAVAVVALAVVFWRR